MYQKRLLLQQFLRNVAGFGSGGYRRWRYTNFQNLKQQ